MIPHSENYSSVRTFEFIIDFDCPLEDIIKKTAWDKVNESMNGSCFPDERTGEHRITVEAINFKGNTEKDEAIAAFKKSKIKPATIHELGTLMWEHPEEQKNVRTIALGSTLSDIPGTMFTVCQKIEHDKLVLGLSAILTVTNYDSKTTLLAISKDIRL